MLRDEDVRSGLRRSVVFVLTLIGVLVILVLLCVVLPLSVGSSAAERSYYGGYHDHRL